MPRRIRPGDALWTYEQIATLLNTTPRSISQTLRRYNIPKVRKRQNVRRYVLQGDVERLLAAFTVKVAPPKPWSRKYDQEARKA